MRAASASGAPSGDSECGRKLRASVCQKSAGLPPLERTRSAWSISSRTIRSWRSIAVSCARTAMSLPVGYRHSTCLSHAGVTARLQFSGRSLAGWPSTACSRLRLPHRASSVEPLPSITRHHPARWPDPPRQSHSTIMRRSATSNARVQQRERQRGRQPRQLVTPPGQGRQHGSTADYSTTLFQKQRAAATPRPTLVRPAHLGAGSSGARRRHRAHRCPAIPGRLAPACTPLHHAGGDGGSRARHASPRCPSRTAHPVKRPGRAGGAGAGATAHCGNAESACRGHRDPPSHSNHNYPAHPHGSTVGGPGWP